jgi:DNA-binding transcriptional ArsR family regulator
MRRRRSNAGASRGAAGGSAVVFAALGDPMRLTIVRRLCDEGPLSIAKLTAGSDVTRQAITKHLRVMERARILRSERKGRERRWRIEQRRLAEARHYLDLISKQWDGALGRLKAFAEE